MAGIMYRDTFKVNRIDFDPATGQSIKKFDKVSRIEAKSETYDTELTLDVNTEIYPIMQSETIEILLSEQLDDAATKPDSADDMQGYNPTKPLGDRADDFEYIMRGKIFKYTEKHMRATIYFSFGGLLMALTGESKVLVSHIYTVDSGVYLFVRKK